jgi:methionyl-tRNA synthetase
VPKSNKLLKLLVDIGTEERVIVAGISKAYKPEELQGKKVVIVANLAPAKLMGIESHGMILATDSADTLSVLSFDREPETGGRVR